MEADHPSGIHLLATEALDGVHRVDDVTFGVRELLQAVPGYDVNGAARVDQNSPYNCSRYLYLND